MVAVTSRRTSAVFAVANAGSSRPSTSTWTAAVQLRVKASSSTAVSRNITPAVSNPNVPANSSTSRRASLNCPLARSCPIRAVPASSNTPNCSGPDTGSGSAVVSGANDSSSSARNRIRCANNRASAASASAIAANNPR